MKKTKSQSKAIEVTVNGKAENSQDFGLNFVQEFGLSTALSLLLPNANTELLKILASNLVCAPKSLRKNSKKLTGTGGAVCKGATPSVEQ